MKQLLVFILLWQCVTASTTEAGDPLFEIPSFIPSFIPSLIPELVKLEPLVEVSDSDPVRIAAAAKQFIVTADCVLNWSEPCCERSAVTLLLLAGSISSNIVRLIKADNSPAFPLDVSHAMATKLVELFLSFDRDMAFSEMPDSLWILFVMFLTANSQVIAKHDFALVEEWLFSKVKTEKAMKDCISWLLAFADLDTPIPASLLSSNIVDSKTLDLFIDMYTDKLLVDATPRSINSIQSVNIRHFLSEIVRRKLYPKSETVEALLRHLPSVLRQTPELGIASILACLHYLVALFATKPCIMGLIALVFLSDRFLSGPSDQLDLQVAADVLNAVNFTAPELGTLHIETLSESARQQLAKVAVIQGKLKPLMTLFQCIRTCMKPDSNASTQTPSEFVSPTKAFNFASEGALEKVYRHLCKAESIVVQDSCPKIFNTVASVLRDIICQIAPTCAFTSHPFHSISLKIMAQAAVILLLTGLEALRRISVQYIVFSVAQMQVNQNAEANIFLAKVSHMFSPVGLAQMALQYYTENPQTFFGPTVLSVYLQFTSRLDTEASLLSHQFTSICIARNAVDYLKHFCNKTYTFINVSAVKVSILLPRLLEYLNSSKTNNDCDKLMPYIKHLRPVDLTRTERKILSLVKERLGSKNAELNEALAKLINDDGC